MPGAGSRLDGRDWQWQGGAWFPSRFSISRRFPRARRCGQALANTLDLARHAEAWGYRRFWLAEHHNMPGIASAATAVLIGQVAAATRTIRVGAGGIMLPNHAPLMVAEQFGTLATLFPGRIDLGLGRAPGTDLATARALRRHLDQARQLPAGRGRADRLLRRRRGGAGAGGARRGTRVPVWILGSSLFGAQLAAYLGLPYAFASHFAPGDSSRRSRSTARRSSRPEQLAAPHVMLAFNVFAAETDAEGRRLMTSMQQAFVNLRTGRPGAAAAAGRRHRARWPTRGAGDGRPGARLLGGRCAGDGAAGAAPRSSRGTGRTS